MNLVAKRWWWLSNMEWWSVKVRERWRCVCVNERKKKKSDIFLRSHTCDPPTPLPSTTQSHQYHLISHSLLTGLSLCLLSFTKHTHTPPSLSHLHRPPLHWITATIFLRRDSPRNFIKISRLLHLKLLR